MPLPKKSNMHWGSLRPKKISALYVKVCKNTLLLPLASVGNKKKHLADIVKVVKDDEISQG